MCKSEKIIIVVWSLICMLSSVFAWAFANNMFEPLGQGNKEYVQKQEQLSRELLANMEIAMGGEIIGIKRSSNGVKVTGVLQDSPRNKFDEGDYLLEVNGNAVESGKDITKILKESSGDEVIVKIDRNGKIVQRKVIPTLSSNGSYDLGVTIQNSGLAIGTISFFDKKSGRFAAVGHQINQPLEGNISEFNRISNCQILDIIKGRSKIPGRIEGKISRDIIGTIYTNSEYGIYGDIRKECIPNSEPIQVAQRTEVKKGPAEIYLALDGKTIERFDVKIKKIRYYSKGNKAIEIQVVDKNLIEKTGGIVKGMSGSPIVQNGKLIGALSYVTVNSPITGFGTFVDNMIIQLSTTQSNIGK